jgi:hypothetical protein
MWREDNGLRTDTAILATWETDQGPVTVGAGSDPDIDFDDF